MGLGLGFRHKFRIYDDLENIIGGFVEEDEETNGFIINEEPLWLPILQPKQI